MAVANPKPDAPPVTKKVFESIKTALDPNNVIAPGRYGIMAKDSTMPAARRFSSISERKNCEGVYTSKMAPYNRPSLLLAEPLKEEKEEAEVL